MTTHLSPGLLARYADRAAVLDEVTMWSVESHLEECAGCRALLADCMAGDALIARVAAGVDLGIAAGPAPAPRRRSLTVRNRWFVWHLAPWLTMTVAILGGAVLLQALEPRVPLVLLLAPVAPLPGVAVAWSRRHDPAWELIAGTPAAGLLMLLRRTAAVLAVIIPALALASNRTGVSLALALLPCLAFSAATIVLGGFIGVRRAAVWLGSLWTLAVVVPTIATVHPPALLQSGTSGFWALLTLILAGLAAMKSASFRRLSSHN
ncbi:zf-HC2 domain-containing protein [Actinoplanes sp. NPDC026619]|uniref:zf-HC2 domain-containing protein n=1 Tax=Actinoplanes sp. NPDC026619 TaxID=3155798 RepID=UPI0033E303CA